MKASNRLADYSSTVSAFQKAMDNIMDAIEKMGYIKRLQKPYDDRKQICGSATTR